MINRRYLRSQGGYTLIEVIITTALGLVVMTALTSVVLTTARAAKVAEGRIEASSQVRSLELRAYDDFARSGLPATSGCGNSVANACRTSPIVLTGFQVTNSTQPVPAGYTVTYQWDGSAFVDRRVGSGSPTHTATNVTAFSWFIDGTAPNQTVVVNLTVTVFSYSESQTLRFYPRLNP
jgi:prepilin-type N-terminal cleavage/methylation domain-containing protein